MNLAETVSSRVTEIATNLSKGLDTSPIKSGIDNVKSNISGLVEDNRGEFEQGLENLKEISNNSGITSKVDEFHDKMAEIKEQYEPMVNSNINKFKENPTLKELMAIKSKTNDRVEALKKQISSKVPNPDSVIPNLDKIYSMSKHGSDLKKFNNPNKMIKDVEKQVQTEIPKIGDLNIDTSGLEIPKIGDLNIQPPEIPKIDKNAMKPKIDMEGILNGFYNFKLP